MPDHCRCGWPGEGQHRCHANRLNGDLRCPREGKPREQIVAKPFGTYSLAGMQMKVAAEVRTSNLCDECWAEFLALQAKGAEHGN